MPTPLVLSETMLEGSTGFYTFTIDQDVAFLTALTLTLYDMDTLAIINTRENQNVLNANGCTVTTDPGTPLVTTITLEITPADNVILNSHRIVEYRVLQ